MQTNTLLLIRVAQVLALLGIITYGASDLVHAATTNAAGTSTSTTTYTSPDKKLSLNIDAEDENTNSPVAIKSSPSGATSIEINEDGDDHDIHHSSSDSLMDNLIDNLIPLAGIAATFGTPVLIVFFFCYYRHRRRQATLDLVREYLNKGQPVPPQLLDDAAGCGSSAGKDYSFNMNRTQNDVRKGLKLIFIGLGVSIALYFGIGHGTAWAWGLIPAVMGVGFLISGLIDNSQRKPGDDSRPPTNPPGSSSL